MPKEYFVVGTFKASSGNRWWRVARDENGDLSCTCPGWCRRVAADGSRTCKHVRKVDARQQTEGRAVKAPSAPPIRVVPTRRGSPLGERRFRL